MKVFKFGGASIKDAQSVRRVTSVLNHYPNDEILIVISAMGKTTNLLEGIVESFINDKKDKVEQGIKQLRENHVAILKELIPNENNKIYNDVEILIVQLELITQAEPEGNYNRVYDQIVSFGELLSTKIVSAYLNTIDFENHWLDSRRLVKTDKNYRFARVDWQFTERQIKETVKEGRRYIVQGFIGSDDDFNPTTLGREGSDYTASVFAYVLNAEEVTIWKDVPGVLNGDPRVFDNTVLLNTISYREAVELAYYGASVIHPKTIQPLREKQIPLRVKSFLNPEGTGSVITEGAHLEPFMPCFICKQNQVMVRIATTDLAFIVEDHLSKVYQIFHQFGVRVNLSQNTAISTSFCINNDSEIVPKLIEKLKEDFDTSYVENVTLYTVRHHDAPSRKQIKQAGEVLMEQSNEETYQVVVKA